MIIFSKLCTTSLFFILANRHSDILECVHNKIDHSFLRSIVFSFRWSNLPNVKLSLLIDCYTKDDVHVVIEKGYNSKKKKTWKMI